MVKLHQLARPFMVGVIVERQLPAASRAAVAAIRAGADALELNLASLAAAPARVDFRRWRVPVYTSCRRAAFMRVYGRKFSRLPTREDAERMDIQMAALAAGAAGIDIEADTFAPEPDEWTSRSAAIQRQRTLAQAVHDRGGTVVFSWHPPRKLRSGEALDRARRLRDRGADFVKIVERVRTPAEALHSLGISLLLERELGLPFVFLALGEPAVRFRPLMTRFGAAYLLARPPIGSNRIAAQPLVATARTILDLA